MLTHMSETVSKHSYELLSRAEIMRLIETVNKNSPELVESIPEYYFIQQFPENIVQPS